MTKPVTVTLSHEHSKAEAKQRLEQGLGKLTSQLGAVAKVEHDWRGDVMDFRARAMMQTVTGEVEVLEDQVRITVMLPGLLAGMAEKVTGSLKKQGTLLLEKK